MKRGDLISILPFGGISTGYSGDLPPSEYAFHKAVTVDNRLGIITKVSSDKRWCHVLLPSWGTSLVWLASSRLRRA